MRRWTGEELEGDATQQPNAHCCSDASCNRAWLDLQAQWSDCEDRIWSRVFRSSTRLQCVSIVVEGPQEARHVAGLLEHVRMQRELLARHNGHVKMRCRGRGARSGSEWSSPNTRYCRRVETRSPRVVMCALNFAATGTGCVGQQTTCPRAKAASSKPPTAMSTLSPAGRERGAQRVGVRRRRGPQRSHQRAPGAPRTR